MSRQAIADRTPRRCHRCSNVGPRIVTSLLGREIWVHYGCLTAREKRERRAEKKL